MQKDIWISPNAVGCFERHLKSAEINHDFVVGAVQVWLAYCKNGGDKAFKNGYDKTASTLLKAFVDEAAHRCRRDEWKRAKGIITRRLAVLLATYAE